MINRQARAVGAAIGTPVAVTHQHILFTEGNPAAIDRPDKFDKLHYGGHFDNKPFHAMNNAFGIAENFNFVAGDEAHGPFPINNI